MKRLILVLVVLAFVGCATEPVNTGSVQGKIQIGSTEMNVLSIMGSPMNTVNLENGQVWIYYTTLLGQRMYPNGKAILTKTEITIVKDIVVAITQHRGINP
jgi:hypothetical protein